MNENHLIETRDIVLSLILGALLVIVVNIRVISDVLFINSDEGFIFIDNQIAVNSTKFFEVIDDLTFISTAVDALLWAFVGAIVYFLLNFLFAEMKTIVDDINISTRYVHPKNFNQSGFWISALWFFLYPLCVGLGSILWVFFSLKVLLPFSSVMFILGFSRSGLEMSLLYVLMSFGTICLMILGFIVFLKILKEFPKIAQKK